MDSYRITGGRVRGREVAGGVAAFLGIPYAAPPFGPDRFGEPRPVTPWSGVRDCLTYGPISPQSAALPGAPAWAPGDEDILSLNVWTSGGSTEGKPVLCWIHGGAYTFGSSAQPDFDGTALARAGLVVVTVNHRIGFEGYGHVPGGMFPDNRGLLDLIAALRWIRSNIAEFGGDPGNVTVAGQSSGAGSIACLMALDEAAGLFQRAIAHSVVGPMYSPMLAREMTERVAMAAGTPADSKALREASPAALVAASDRVVASYRANPGSGPQHYDPVLYGPVMDEDPQGSTAPEIDLLVCSTVDEYWLLYAVGSAKAVSTKDDLARFLKDQGLPAHMADGYRELMPGAPTLDVYLAVYGDLVFGEYTARLAETHASAGGRTYVSRFERRREGVRPWHCADVPFAFGTIDDPAVEFLIGGPPDRDDHELSTRMVRAWVDFATSGDPGWDPQGTDGGPVRLWHTGNGPDLGEASPTRRLWRDVDYAPLRP